MNKVQGKNLQARSQVRHRIFSKISQPKIKIIFKYFSLSTQALEANKTYKIESVARLLN